MMQKIYGVEWESIREMDYDTLLNCSKGSMGTDAITGVIGIGIDIVLKIDIIYSKF